MCNSPIAIRDKEEHSGYSHYSVPCGKCHECLSARSKAWVFRLSQELRRHTEATFATLTYSDENLPRDQTGYPTLDKKALQLFFKRLRKSKSGSNASGIRYYACGEYGGNTQRPHYHAIIFGATQNQVNSAWPFGGVYHGTVTDASITYVTKYLLKTSTQPPTAEAEHCFSLMSRGLGANYLTETNVSYHEKSSATFVYRAGGWKQPLPRYLKDRIFSPENQKALGNAYRAQHTLDAIEDGFYRVINSKTSTDEQREHASAALTQHLKNKHEATQAAIRRAHFLQQKSKDRL